MKKAVFYLLIAGGISLTACGAKQASKGNGADTAVIVYGQESITPVDSDSVMVSVQDTAIEIITEPVNNKAPKKDKTHQKKK